MRLRKGLGGSGKVLGGDTQGAEPRLRKVLVWDHTKCWRNLAMGAIAAHVVPFRIAFQLSVRSQASTLRDPTQALYVIAHQHFA
jgi:hypothetical protein